MNDRFHILLPTDVFPPVSGGSGWSAHALAMALQRRGHRVTAIVPRQGQSGIQRRTERGIAVVDVGYNAPGVPFVQNYYRFELLWPLLRNVIVAEAYRDPSLPVIIHGQHAQTIPAAVLAGRELAVPVVATIRDAWPSHYFATGLLGDRVPFDRSSPWIDWLDLIGRLGPLKGVLAAPATPYMRRHVQHRAELLAQADAVIACSHYIAHKLAPIVKPDRLHVVPHLIDVASTEARSRASGAGSEEHDPFVLFVGKLERNKGAHLLPAALEAARQAGAHLPRLVIAGNGRLQAELQESLAERGITHEFAGGWVDHDQVLRLMREAEVLLFPSAWGEPLSRVLLEGLAVGACIAAIDTGGTRDMIEDGVNGLLVRDEAELGRALARLLSDPQQCAQLRLAAQRTARERFAAEVVAQQIENVYVTTNTRE